METEKGGFKRVLDSFHQTLKKNCRNIHRSVWQLLGVAKIQNGAILKKSTLSCRTSHGI
jgi:hypothetical protein